MPDTDRAVAELKVAKNIAFYQRLYFSGEWDSYVS